jgi:hypothetical protein
LRGVADNRVDSKDIVVSFPQAMSLETGRVFLNPDCHSGLRIPWVRQESDHKQEIRLIEPPGNIEPRGNNDSAGYNVPP